MSLRVVLIGRSNKAITPIARKLQRPHSFKYMAFMDGVRKIDDIIYGGKKYKRLNWEKKIRIYDELYKVDSNIWITYLKQKLDVTTRDVVIPDVRYLNELEQLRNMGFIVVRVTTDRISKEHLTHKVMNAAPGTIIVADWYDANFSDKVRADYSIHYTDIASAEVSVADLVAKLRSA